MHFMWWSLHVTSSYPQHCIESIFRVKVSLLHRIAFLCYLSWRLHSLMLQTKMLFWKKLKTDVQQDHLGLICQTRPVSVCVCCLARICVTYNTAKWSARAAHTYTFSDPVPLAHGPPMAPVISAWSFGFPLLKHIKIVPTETGTEVRTFHCYATCINTPLVVESVTRLCFSHLLG